VSAGKRPGGAVITDSSLVPWYRRTPAAPERVYQPGRGDDNQAAAKEEEAGHG